MNLNPEVHTVTNQTEFILKYLKERQMMRNLDNIRICIKTVMIDSLYLLTSYSQMFKPGSHACKNSHCLLIWQRLSKLSTQSASHWQKAGHRFFFSTVKSLIISLYLYLLLLDVCSSPFDDQPWVLCRELKQWFERIFIGRNVLLCSQASDNKRC